MKIKVSYISKILSFLKPNVEFKLLIEILNNQKLPPVQRLPFSWNLHLFIQLQ